VNFANESPVLPRARKSDRHRIAAWPNFVAAAALGALVTLVTIWSLGGQSPNVGTLNPIQSGFDSKTVKIIDQLGTVEVDVWVKNDSSVAKSTTCAIEVNVGTGQKRHMYLGSAAFTLTSVKPLESRHLIEMVTGVYYDGDATGPIGSMLLPLPQYAKLSKRSLIECS
jgi:hypothetical protein